jgi:Bacterial Ig-like domain (group 3)
MVDGRRSWRLLISMLVPAMAFVAVSLAQPATAGAAHATVTEVECPESVTDRTQFNCKVFVNGDDTLVPIGRVRFLDGTQGGTFSPGTCDLERLSDSDIATCTTTYSAVSLGSREIEAVYESANPVAFESSTGTTAVSFRAITLATLDCSPSTVAVESTSTCEIFMVHLAGANESNRVPSGRVAFAALGGGGTFTPESFCDLRPRNETASSCRVDFTPHETLGSREIVTLYLGDDFNEGTRFLQEGTGGVDVVAPRSTVVTVTCLPERVGLNQPSGCVARVDDDQPNPTPVSGSIRFERDATDGAGSFSDDGECELDQESSSCEVEYTPTARGSGAHRITARYSGDAVHGESSGTGQVLVKTAEEEAEDAKTPTVTEVQCGPDRLAKGRTSFCTAIVERTGSNPNPLTGSVHFTTGEQGDFSRASCSLQSTGSAPATCEFTYVPTAVGSGRHRITAEYDGDADYRKSRGEATLTVGSIRFAEPGGDGADPCAERTNPCSLFTAADRSASGTTVKAGDEVILAPGLYTSAAGDLGLRGFTTLAANIDFHGERGLPRPVIDIAPEVVPLAGISIQSGDVVSHMEVKSSTIPVVIFTSGFVEDVIVRSSAEGALACAQADGVIRDSACLTSGANATAIGLEPSGPISRFLRLRNVTAISTGDGSVGLRYSARGGSLGIEAKSVIAHGAATDAVARGLSNPFSPDTGGEVQIAFDHSDYATTSTATDAGGLATVTPAGSGTNIVAEPRLAADQVHQRAASPTVDAGATDGLSGEFDIDGELRAGDGTADIGADEFVVGSTETELRCGPGPVEVDATTTCTAEVTNLGAIEGAPTGSVEFTTEDPGDFAPISCELEGPVEKTASCSATYTPEEATPALHHLNATFKGSPEHGLSADSLDLEVTEQGGGDQQDTTTALTCVLGSVEADHQSRCTATVTGTTTAPTGRVRFTTDDPGDFTPISCELENPVDDHASCAVDYTPDEATPTLHLLKATYTGTTEHAFSEDTFDLTVTEDGSGGGGGGGGESNSTSTTLNCVPDDAILGGGSVCTAIVEGTADADRSAPTGIVGLTADSAGVFSNICTLAPIGQDKARCQAVYEPDPNLAEIGEHELFAEYEGDEDHETSETTAQITVAGPSGGHDTATALECEPSTVILGGVSICTVTVRDLGPDPAVPGGGVFFASDSGGDFSTGGCLLFAVGQGEARCQLIYKPFQDDPAVHRITAVYPGNASHEPSINSDLVNVEPPNGGHRTTTALECQPIIVSVGDTTTCTATVTDEDDDPTDPTRAVVFASDSPGGFDVGGCQLEPPDGDGQATCEFTYRPLEVGTGTHQISAAYEGDNGHVPSPVTSDEVTVTPLIPPPPPGSGQDPKPMPIPSKVTPPPSSAPSAPPTAPNTILKKKPRKRTAKRRAKFKFVSDQPGSTFQCKLDKKPFKACRTPWKKKVKPGRHNFRVRAINPQGIADPTPAVFKWKVGKVKKR